VHYHNRLVSKLKELTNKYGDAKSAFKSEEFQDEREKIQEKLQEKRALVERNVFDDNGVILKNFRYSCEFYRHGITNLITRHSEGKHIDAEQYIDSYIVG
jgi:hypothetical protein